jgi:hypothetical protein
VFCDSIFKRFVITQGNKIDNAQQKWQSCLLGLPALDLITWILLVGEEDPTAWILKSAWGEILQRTYSPCKAQFSSNGVVFYMTNMRQTIQCSIDNKYTLQMNKCAFLTFSTYSFRQILKIKYWQKKEPQKSELTNVKDLIIICWVLCILSALVTSSYYDKLVCHQHVQGDMT